MAGLELSELTDQTIHACTRDVIALFRSLSKTRPVFRQHSNAPIERDYVVDPAFQIKGNASEVRLCLSRRTDRRTGRTTLSRLAVMVGRSVGPLHIDVEIHSLDVCVIRSYYRRAVHQTNAVMHRTTPNRPRIENKYIYSRARNLHIFAFSFAVARAVQFFPHCPVRNHHSVLPPYSVSGIVPRTDGGFVLWPRRSAMQDFITLGTAPVDVACAQPGRDGLLPDSEKVSVGRFIDCCARHLL